MFDAPAGRRAAVEAHRAMADRREVALAVVLMTSAGLMMRSFAAGVGRSWVPPRRCPDAGGRAARSDCARNRHHSWASLPRVRLFRESGRGRGGSFALLGGSTEFIERVGSGLVSTRAKAFECCQASSRPSAPAPDAGGSRPKPTGSGHVVVINGPPRASSAPTCGSRGPTRCRLGRAPGRSSGWSVTCCRAVAQGPGRRNVSLPSSTRPRRVAEAGIVVRQSGKGVIIARQLRRPAHAIGPRVQVMRSAAAATVGDVVATASHVLLGLLGSLGLLLALSASSA